MDYSRIPGPGDLPGDSRNPNSPDYTAPAFDENDAADSVARDMVKRNRIGQADVSAVAEIVGEVAENAAALAWVVQNANLPADYAQTIQWLAKRAEQLDKAIGDRFELLNRGEAA